MLYHTDILNILNNVTKLHLLYFERHHRPIGFVRRTKRTDISVGPVTLRCLFVCIDMKDFAQLSSATVTEVLMLEMKMSPAATAYLVSGYPRNMRDVVEYTNKVS